MARPQVPKFGDWDNADAKVPITQCFEHARKVKSGRRMHPEENPEALGNMSGALGSNSDRQREALQAPPAVNSAISAERSHTDGHHRQNAPIKKKSYDDLQKGLRSRKIMASESDSEKSSTSDHSQSNPRRSYSGQKKGRAGRSSFSSSGTGKSSIKSVSFQVGKKEHKKTASIPKFGDWDEKNPKSGENFTEIFELAKEEKKDPSSKFPLPPPETNEHESHCSKTMQMFCCVFPCGANQ